MLIRRQVSFSTPESELRDQFENWLDTDDNVLILTKRGVSEEQMGKAMEILVPERKELEDAIEKAFCEGYLYAQREYDDAFNPTFGQRLQHGVNAFKNKITGKDSIDAAQEQWKNGTYGNNDSDPSKDRRTNLYVNGYDPKNVQDTINKGAAEVDRLYKEKQNNKTNSASMGGNGGKKDDSAYQNAAKEIWSGKWGNGHDVREAKAKELGLDYNRLRQTVNNYNKK